MKCTDDLADDARIAQLPQGALSDAKQYYEFMANRITISIAPRDKVEQDKYTEIMLSKKMTYDQMSARVGERLAVDPTHLRFWTVNAQTGKPKSAVKRSATLSHILYPQFSSYGYNSQRQDMLYYDILDQSLAEFETKKPLKLILLSEGITKEVSPGTFVVHIATLMIFSQTTFDVMVPKNGFVSDALAALQDKAKLDDDTIQHMRIYEVHSGKVHKELAESHSLANINEWVALYAERIPEEELNASDTEQVIYAYHFDKEPNKPHGVPFKFLMKPVCIIFSPRLSMKETC